MFAEPISNTKGKLWFYLKPLVVILIMTHSSPAFDTPPVSASSGGHGGGGAVAPASSYINRMEMRKREKEIKERQRKEQKEWEEFEKSFENMNTPSQPKKVIRKRPAIKTIKDHPETQGSRLSRQFLLQRSMTGIDDDFARMVWEEPADALRKYSSRQRSAEKKGDPGYKHKTNMDLGNVYYLLGLYSKARESFSKAEGKDDANLPANDTASAKNSIASINEVTADYESAKSAYTEALGIFQQTGNENGQTMVLTNLGVMAMNRGDLSSAVDYYERALDKAKNGHNKSRVLSLMNAGKGLRRWGLVRESIEHFDQAIELAREAGDHSKTAELLSEKANALAGMEMIDKAIESLKAALKEAEKADQPTYEINHRIAGLLMGQGKLDEAESYVKKGKYKTDLARLALLRADFKEAGKQYNELKRSAQRYNRLSDLFVAHLGMAKVHEALGKERSADRMYSKAVELGEELRMSRLLSDRKGFFAEPVGGFKPLEAGNGLIRIKLKVNRARDSIYPGELSKARIFADSIGRRADISKMGAPKELISEEEMLFNRLASLKKALSALPKSKAPTRYREISQQIKIAEREILAFEKKVKSSYKQYASVRFPDPVKLSNARLNPDQYYLVYDVLENGVAIRLLKGKSVVETTFSKLDRGELIRMIREFRSSFEQARLGAFNVDLAERLYGILVKPVIGEVPKGVNLIIVPDDALSILPFEALVESGAVEWKAADWGPYPSGLKYLFDRNPINLRQSLTAITLAKTLEFGKNDGRSLLVLADPVFQAADERAGRALASRNEEVSAGPNVVVMEAISEYSKLGFQLNRLKATGKLADKLGDMFPGAAKVFKGISANKETLFNDKGPELGRFRWVVLATHGYAAADMPGIMEPFIALSMIPRSQDGFVRMTEVLDLKLNADLVALTACQTGHGKIIPGEGVISLGRAFQCAGARSTLVSLWSVSEITSVKLMEMFFERLKEGEKTGQAWRKARLNLRSSGYDHPFFWAPFIMVGQAN